MRRNKKLGISLIMIIVMMLSMIIAGCAGVKEKDNDDKNNPLVPPVDAEELKAYEYDDTKDYSVKVPEGITVKREFFDDFDSGLSDSDWSVVNYGWGDGNNGMSMSNVLYSTHEKNVTDFGASGGMVIMRSQGSFAADPSHRKRGGAIITRDTFGAGLYEVRMKIVPRMGACTAAWTYYNGSLKEEYSEIDIEFPVNNGFLHGSYTTYKWFESFPADLDHDNITKLNDFPFNDGKWHNYAFEWRTDPEESVRWYIDGKEVAHTGKSVPEYEAQYWIGNWFPPGWAGAANFDTAYMYVDYVRITEYDEPNGIVNATTRGGAGSTTNAINLGAAPIPVNDYIANGGFSTEGSASGSALGWQLAGSAVRVTEGADSYLLLTAGTEATQLITAQYKGYKFLIEAEGSVGALGDKLIITIEYLRGNVLVPNTGKTLVLSGTELNSQELTVIIPTGASAALDPDTIRVRVTVEGKDEAKLHSLKMTLLN